MPIILKIHLLFSCIIAALILTIQLVTCKNFMNNWIYISARTKEAAIKMSRKNPPFDGVILTAIISLVPLINIGYTIFCFILGVSKQDSLIIQEMRGFIDD